MSTQESESEGWRERHKAINLYRDDQIGAYDRARRVVKDEIDGPVSEGDVVERLATRYIGEPRDELVICEMVSETAADNGDPSFPYEVLSQVDGQTLDKLAKLVESDAIDPFSTNLEIIAYFCCPPKNHD